MRVGRVFAREDAAAREAGACFGEKRRAAAGGERCSARRGEPYGSGGAVRPEGAVGAAIRLRVCCAAP